LKCQQNPLAPVHKNSFSAKNLTRMFLSSYVKPTLLNLESRQLFFNIFVSQ